MNNQRRAQIQKALFMLSEAQEILSCCAEEEQEYYDNMPESFQQGEKGTAAEDAATHLQEAADLAEGAKDSVDLALNA